MKGRCEIVCETRRGFHTSLGRGNPCTLVGKKKDAGFALLEQASQKMARLFVSSRAESAEPRDPGSYLARYFTGEARIRN